MRWSLALAMSLLLGTAVAAQSIAPGLQVRETIVAFAPTVDLPMASAESLGAALPTAATLAPLEATRDEPAPVAGLEPVGAPIAPAPGRLDPAQAARPKAQRPAPVAAEPVAPPRTAPRIAEPRRHIERERPVTAQRTREVGRFWPPVF